MSRAQAAPTLTAATAAVAEADRELTDALERWSATMAARLDDLSQALAAHIEEAEGPGGLFASVLEEAPHLQNRVQRLTDEHGVLTVRIADSRKAADALRPVDQPGSVRSLHESVHELITLLDSHIHQSCQMTYDAASQEFGGG